MSIIYKSKRVGKNGKPFFMYKFKTLKDGSDSNMFAHQGEYTRFGKFLRLTKLDELPQIWNILKGDMSLVGPRAEEQRTIEIIPESTKKTILSVKPGLTSPASLHFADEEKILEKLKEPDKVYWGTIKPMKFLLDVWYVQHKNLFIDLGIIWASLKYLIIRK